MSFQSEPAVAPVSPPATGDEDIAATKTNRRSQSGVPTGYHTDSQRSFCRTLLRASTGEAPDSVNGEESGARVMLVYTGAPKEQAPC
jgi:hypothetical protein